VKFLYSRFNFDGSWNLRESQVLDRLKESGNVQINEFMSQLFQGVIKEIHDYIASRGKKKMKVILLPESVYPLVMSYLAEQYKSNDSNNVWSMRNDELRIFMPPSHETIGSQYSVVDNIEVLSNVDPQANLLFMELKNVLEGTPTNESGESVYENLLNIEINNKALKTGDVGTKSQAALWPHISYILATQGNGEISYENSRELDKRLNFPVLILGTKEEWSSFSESAGEFLNYGYQDWFDVNTINPPSLDSKVDLLASIFKDPHIAMLGYKFDSTGITRRKNGEVISPVDEMRNVLRYAVNRVESNAKAIDSNPFSIYLDFLTLFSRTLVQDRTVRNSQVINKALIEILMSKMFNIPLNRNFLPKNDPLYLLSRKDAAVKLQEAGYNGPITLKRRFIDVLVSQLTQAQTKPIPSSMILAGDTGSGKTHTFESLVKMLGLKLYNFDRSQIENNEEANAIVIKSDKLVTESKAVASHSSNSMSVEQAIKHLEHFLTLPNGYRGFILIDDLHGAPDEVREKLLQYLRALFESRDGMYTIEQSNIKVGSKAIAIKSTRYPVRGLNIIVTMNFTENQDKIKKFSKKPGEPTLEELILATLSTSKHNIEKSFLRRWGDIIPLSTFPAEAKAPGLLDAFFKRSKDTLELRSKLALLSPRLVRKIVSKFKTTDARTFLADATNILFTLFDNDSDLENEEDGSVQIIIPNIDKYDSAKQIETLDVKSDDSLHLEHLAAQSEIGKYVFENSQIINI
ncbi:MAG: hypothetical protein KDD40_08880, partial [Bdellovibrionales bacterium]|nr:hypothetical protein [Bdellovibrionales bacterium]